MAEKRTSVDELHSNFEKKRKNLSNSCPLDEYGVLYSLITRFAQSFSTEKGETLLITIEIEDGGLSIYRDSDDDRKIYRFPLLIEYSNYLANKYPGQVHENNDSELEKNEYTQQFIKDVRPSVEYFEQQHPFWNVSIEPGASDITDSPPTLYICDNYVTWQFIF